MQCVHQERTILKVFLAVCLPGWNVTQGIGPKHIAFDRRTPSSRAQQSRSRIFQIHPSAAEMFP